MNTIIPGMAEFDNFLDGFDHIAFFENELSQYWSQSKRIVDNQVKRKSWSINLENHLDDPNVRNYYHEFLYKLDNALQEYKDFYNIGEISAEIKNEKYILTLLKYEDTDEIDYHYDTSYSDDRIAAALGYFNDDYVDGELEFKHFGLRFKPKRNSLLIFPANHPYTHRSNKVSGGIKYAIRCFLVSK